MGDSLATLDRISRQLSTLAKVDDVADLRNKAAALETYYRTQKGCREIERSATIIRLRAERRIGELLSAKVRKGSKCNPELHIPDGISRVQSSRWQQISKLPESQFEKYLGTNRKPSTVGLLKLATIHRRRRAAHRGPDHGCGIFSGDMWQLNHRLPDGSTALFLTDPPYQQIDEYTRLAELASKKLKDGGLCLAYCGVFQLPAVLASMAKHLDYWWTITVHLPKKHRLIHERNVSSAWTPIVCFSKGIVTREVIVDHLVSTPADRTDHNHSKPEPEIQYLIERLTDKNELVCDPYCGSGTTLVAAKKLGRRFIGTEINATTARIARQRLAA